MKTFLAKSLRRLWTMLPRCGWLFRISRMYVNFYEGDDNPDIVTNGEAKALREFLPRCAVAFDAGAHRGDWARLAHAANSSLVIHCFEPSSAPFARLSELAAISKNFVLNHCALSDRAGTASLHLHAASPDTDSLHATTAGGIAPETGMETVSVQTLDDYCETNRIAAIDYLKIDVEGHEWSVLQGARRLLENRAIRFVQMEYGPAYLQASKRLADIYALLMPLGYRAFKITPKGLMRHDYSPELETFRLSNWLFVRSDESTKF